MLSEFHGCPKPNSSFNLFYLESNEIVISSVKSKFKSTNYQR